MTGHTWGIIPCSDVSLGELDEILAVTKAFTDRHVAVINSADDRYRHDISQLLKQSGGEVIEFSAPVGKAEAVRTGIRAALSQRDCEFVYQVDGHLKQSPAFISQLLKDLDHVALAVYSRYSTGKLVGEHRGLLVRLMIAVVHKTVGLHLHDTVCGTRAYTRAFASTLLDVSRSVSYGLEIEQVLIAGAHALPVSEYAVPSARQASSTASEKLLVNFWTVYRTAYDQLSLSMRRELNALITALGQFQRFELDASLWDESLGSVLFDPVASGEDGEASYRLRALS